MKTFASFAVLLSMVVVLSGCGSKEAPEPSGDAPDVHVPAEPSAVPPPAAPTFDDESDPVPGPAPVAPALEDSSAEPAAPDMGTGMGTGMGMGEPAATEPADPGMGMGEPAATEPAATEPAATEPAAGDSAGDAGSPGVTKAFGAALWKGVTRGATGTP